MDKASIKWNPDGSIMEITNLVATETGLMRTNLPVNAVLVQMVEQEDEDGEKSYAYITSVICKDPGMKEVLLREATQIIEERHRR